MVGQHDLNQTWAQIQGHLRAYFPENTYAMWLAALSPASIEEGVLYVDAPDGTANWVRRRFGPAIRKAAIAAEPAIQRIELLERTTAPGEGGSHTRAPGRPARAEEPKATFKPAYTFDRFVIGKSNRFAHAAALVTAEMSGHAYNPLLIHGPHGVGKTHLLQAIGNYITNHDASLTVAYTTSENFTAEFTRALRLNEADNFKDVYRRCDALLLDDLQFLEGKPRTAEEFFHTFDSLMTRGTQVVVSSDRDPTVMSFLEPRFKERLQAGLTIHLTPPNRSTRVAILRKLVALNAVDVPAEVITQLAERVTSNVRALEGAFIRMVAFASLSESSITVELADHVLAHLYSSESANAALPVKPNAAQIQAETAAALGLETSDLMSPRRSRPVVYARQIAMYLCRELAGLSYPEIARHFQRRDHTTALHACRKIKAQLLSDHTTRTLVATITESFHTPSHKSSHVRSTAGTPSGEASGNLIHTFPGSNHHS